MRIKQAKVLLGLITATLSAALPTSCKPPKSADSDLTAIISQDGKFAFSLLPMRLYRNRNDQVITSARFAVENAVRITYGAVECVGDNAVAEMNKLEGMTQQIFDVLRRKGRSIVDEDGNALAPTCRVFGDKMLSAASFIAAFSRDPSKLDGDRESLFQLQQTMWLAARGKYGKASAFRLSFYKFLEEGAGAGPTGSDAQRSARIDEIDQRYVPVGAGCLSGSSKSSIGFDKNSLFDCRDGNYVVKGQYASVRSKFSGYVNTFESAYEKAINNLQPDEKNALAGGELATNPNAGDAEMKALSSKTFRFASVQHGTPKSPDEADPEPAIKILLGESAPLEGFFMVSFGLSRGPVLDASNPNPILNLATAGVGGFGLHEGHDEPAAAAPAAAAPAKAEAPAAADKAPSAAAPAQASPAANTASVFSWDNGGKPNAQGQYVGRWSDEPNKQVTATWNTQGIASYQHQNRVSANEPWSISSNSLAGVIPNKQVNWINNLNTAGSAAQSVNVNDIKTAESFNNLFNASAVVGNSYGSQAAISRLETNQGRTVNNYYSVSAPEAGANAVLAQTPIQTLAPRAGGGWTVSFPQGQNQAPTPNVVRVATPVNAPAGAKPVNPAQATNPVNTATGSKQPGATQPATLAAAKAANSNSSAINASSTTPQTLGSVQNSSASSSAVEDPAKRAMVIAQIDGHLARLEQYKRDAGVAIPQDVISRLTLARAELSAASIASNGAPQPKTPVKTVTDQLNAGGFFQNIDRTYKPQGWGDPVMPQDSNAQFDADGNLISY